MNREMILEHLDQAREHVDLGEHHIARQGEIISGLAQGGHDTAQAERFLIQLEEMQVVHVSHRDRGKGIG